MTLCIIIAGSRSFTDYKLLCQVMERMVSKLSEFIILSGGAEGADRLGERWALAPLNTSRCKAVKIFRPDWRKHGKSGGPIRNQEMVDEADALIAFHDGSSPGTADVIRRAKTKGIRVKVVQF